MRFCTWTPSPKNLSQTAQFSLSELLQLQSGTTERYPRLSVTCGSQRGRNEGPCTRGIQIPRGASCVPSMAGGGWGVHLFS